MLAARRTRTSAGVLRPVVVELRDKVMVVTVGWMWGCLEMLEKRAERKVGGKIYRGKAAWI